MNGGGSGELVVISSFMKKIGPFSSSSSLIIGKTLSIATVNLDKNTEKEEKLKREIEIDASFLDHGYVVSRRSNLIGPLELRIVKNGTFKKILEHFIRNGSAMSQFKTPSCTSNKELLSILSFCTVKRVYNTAYAK
ncbi:hypothetical protein DVH24_029372 [Malus domestica]|uniref:GH3 C-terminal domain-containing protein n=1 Tax=Malus domestica TaxID=3750 RepID=A0A498HZS6_MALDO|nr:hypothetical protein DVH24_029372 [Malus domestica]